MRPLRVSIPYLAILLLGAAGGQGAAGKEGPGAEERIRFFEVEVRPILARHCAKCHGEKTRRGGLRLDSRAALLTGGDSGPAVVPGKPEESLLVEAVHYESLEMPPAGRLSDREQAALVAWVKDGATWPDAPAARPADASRGGTGGPGTASRDDDRAWWAFRPVREPRVPEAADDAWSRNPIDRFIARGLRAAGLSPAPEADR